MRWWFAWLSKQPLLHCHASFNTAAASAAAAFAFTAAIAFTTLTHATIVSTSAREIKASAMTPWWCWVAL